ncbi:MAG: YbaB/EbfC family nucleoid-associated protein [Candidatus Margulisiibacteriota bacterium]|jgi:hypothetical protein
MVFGNLGKMGEMMMQAQKIKSQLNKSRYEGEAGGVRVTVNGELEILEITIPQEMGVSKIAGNVKDATNRALKTAKNDVAKVMQKLTGGMNLPGMG